MPDYLDEELQIMDELSSAQQKEALSAAIDIHDPIKDLQLAELISINEDSSIQEVIDLLNSKSMGCMVATDSSGRTSGIFTERDVLRKIIGKDIDLKTAKLKDYMTPNPETLTIDDPIAFALNRMSDGSFRHIPIEENGSVKYMLSIKDVVDHIAFIYRQSVLNLPPNLKQTPTQYGG